MFTQYRFRSFCVFSVLVILISSCAPAVATPTPTGNLPISPTDTQAKKETSITITIPEDPPSFNASVGDTGYDTMVLNLVMLGLTGVDPQGVIYPELAAELPTIENGGVKVDDSAGTMDVIWKLRPDVVWSDGVPLTAEDVVFTWNAIVDPNSGSWIRGSDSVDSVEKVDDHTVVFHYKSIYPAYLTQLGGEQLAIWPAHYCDAKQGYASWDCARKPISTGPYVLKEWQNGDHLTFLRNEKYFEPGKPSIDKIIVKIIPDAAVRKTMMVQGDADINMWVSETIAEELSKESKVKVSTAPTNRWILRLFPNEAARGTTDASASPNPLFADVNVRRAMRMAIDVDTIAKTAFHGYSTPTWTEFNRPPYACSIPRPEFNPTKAAQMLEQAGWKDTNNDGVRECHGCAHAAEGTLMQAKLATYPDYGEPMILAQQLVAEMLKKVGIDLELQVIEGNIMWGDPSSGGTEQTGNYDIDMFDDGYPGTDPTDFISEYYTSASAEPGVGQNFVRYINPELDSLIDEAYTLDEDSRKATFCKIATVLDDQVPNIMLTSIINADAYNVRLQGIESNVNDVVTWNVADWTVTP